MRARIASIISSSLLCAACAVHVSERDVFKPETAQDTTFTIETDEGRLFDHNRPAPGLFERLGISPETGRIPSSAGDIYYQLARNPDVHAPFIIYCGGSAFDVPNHGDLAIWKLHRFGDVMVWDYPGFGLSEGEPSIQNFQNAGFALSMAFRNLQRTPDQKIIFWGHSMGSFACARLAAFVPRADAIVFETATPTSEAAAPYLAPALVRPFIRVELQNGLQDFDNVDVLSGRQIPALVLAATHDEVLPVELSRQLRDGLIATGHDVTYHEFPEGGHFDLGFHGELDEVVPAFIANVMGEPNSRDTQ